MAVPVICPLGRIISTVTFGRLINNASVFNNPYTITELFTDLQKGIWGELETKQPIDLYRRNLQKIYIDKMAAGVTPVSASTPARLTESAAIVRAHLVSLRSKIKVALVVQQDALTRYHLQDLVFKIDNVLSVK